MNRGCNLFDIIEDAKREKDKGITFIGNNKEDKLTTYEQLYNNSLKILHYLQQKGMKKGDELVLTVQDEEQFLTVFWAAILGGIIPVPVSYGKNDEHRNKAIKIWSYLNNPKIIANKNTIDDIETFLISNTIFLDYNIKNNSINIEEIFDLNNNIRVNEKAQPNNIEGNHIAFIQFSSGSTGEPKGIILTHENLCTNCNAIANKIKLTNEDVTLSWLPLTHDMGIIGFHITPMVTLSNQCIMSTNKFIRNPYSWMETAVKYDSTILSSPNFGYKYFLSKFNDEMAQGLDLSKIRLILNGAEPISYDLCNKFLSTMEKYKLKRETMFTVYGMAEASLAIAFPNINEEFKTIFINRNMVSKGKKVEVVDEYDDNAVGFVIEGYPIDDCYIRICNELGENLKEEYIGEIQIKGKNVTKGYYNNEIASKSNIIEGGWLKTGDVGFLKDGQLIVTGRIKDIIFINGQNYYPYDIERVLEELEGIELGKVVVAGNFNRDIQNEEIIVFIRCNKNDNINLLTFKIKEYIRIKMGLFIKDVIAVKKIPKTTSGKIQRYKLIELYNARERVNKSFFIEESKKDTTAGKVISDPLDKTMDKNEIITNIQGQYKLITHELIVSCKDILHKNTITSEENLYELGMDSLKITSLISLIQEKFNVDIQYYEMFKLNTISEVAKHIMEYNLKPYEVNIQNYTLDHRYKYYQTSAAQKRIYIAAQMEEKSIGYNMPEAILIEGDINPIKINKAFKAIINRHEILRTSFELIDGEPLQSINYNVDFDIEYYEASNDKVNRIIDQTIKPFDLLKAPLIRVVLIKIEECKAVLLIDMHHIISDGWSMMVLLEELFMILEEKQLPKIEMQFKDFAKWQNSILKTKEMEVKKNYWLSKLGNNDIPVLNFPTDFKRSNKKSYNGGRITVLSNKDIINNLNSIAIKNSTTTYMITLTAYYVLLSKYSQQEDIIIGSPIAGRQKKQFSKLIGMFVNMIINRNRVKSKMTFKELLFNVKQSCIEAYQNQEYQFDGLVSNLKIKRDLSRNPIFDYVFAFQNLDLPNVTDSKYKIQPYDFEYKISRFDMFLSIMDIGDKVKFMLEYSTDIFKKSTAERVLNHYFEILNQIVNNDEIKIEDIYLTNTLSVASNKIIEDDGNDFEF